MTCVFLSNLNLQHLISFGKSSKQWRNRLSDLEIHRSVLDLKDYVVVVLTIKIFEVVISSPCSVCLVVSPVLSAVIYKASPDDDTAVWLYDISQHICAVSLSSAIGKWSWSSLRICLYKESSK